MFVLNMFPKSGGAAAMYLLRRHPTGGPDSQTDTGGGVNAAGWNTGAWMVATFKSKTLNQQAFLLQEYHVSLPGQTSTGREDGPYSIILTHSKKKLQGCKNIFSGYFLQFVFM